MLGEVALMPQGVVLSRCENKHSVSQDDRAQRSRFRLRAFGGRDAGFGRVLIDEGSRQFEHELIYMVN